MGGNGGGIVVGVRKMGETWGKLRMRVMQPVSLASGRGVGRYPGSPLSSQPSVRVSCPTNDSLSSALRKQDMQQHRMM